VLGSYDGPFESVLLDGCVDDCRSFEALEEAEQHCNALGSSCGGITKSGCSQSFWRLDTEMDVGDDR
jgi:hypothetical protein